MNLRLRSESGKVNLRPGNGALSRRAHTVPSSTSVVLDQFWLTTLGHMPTIRRPVPNPEPVRAR